jgi:hypothetical protein
VPQWPFKSVAVKPGSAELTLAAVSRSSILIDYFFLGAT